MANMWAIALGTVSIFTKAGHFVSSDTAAFWRYPGNKGSQAALHALAGAIYPADAGAKTFPVTTSPDAVFK